MYRSRVMRFDIWLTLLLAYLVSAGAAKITEWIVRDTYQSYVEEHTPAEGEIGSQAGPDVFRV